MGILSRTGDLVYTFRFLKLLTTPFKETNAYKFGIIDADGNRIKSKKIETTDEKSSYNYFHRLVFNLKKLLAKVPGGSNKLATYAAALFLIKEKLELSDKSLEKIIKESNIDPLDFLSEQSEWFLLEDKMLSPGVYRLRNGKMLNKTCEEVVKPKDKIRIHDNSYPVGEVMGLGVYEATHLNTNEQIYITVGELIR